LTTATGRVFLAYPPDESAMHLAASELGARSEGELTTKQREEIARLRQTVRRARLGTTDGDVIPGLSAVATPVFDCNGKIAAVIAVLAESRDLKGAARQRVVATLQAAGDAVSSAQGFSQLPHGPGSFSEWLESVWGHTLARAPPSEEGPTKRRAVSG
jgi:DNA-binding IclR family transcriptional regulator